MPQFPNDYPAYDKASKDIENDKILIDQDGTTKAAKISDISGGGISQNYSTSEIALRNSDGTPLLWIDGKQIFQRSLIGFGFLISNVSYLVSVFGVAMNDFSSVTIRNAIGSSELANFQCQLDLSVNELRVKSNSFGDIFVTVQYTKI